MSAAREMLCDTARAVFAGGRAEAVADAGFDQLLVAETDGGCLLIFTNIFPDRAAAVPAAAGWHAGLEVVEAQLDGRPLDWSLWERAEQLAGDYRHFDR